MTVEVESYEGRYLRVELPETVILEISETEPTVKGQTAASSFKPAILENGVRVMVPPFVGTGEKIVVNTTDGTYVRRAED
jgi:elongation factor P